MNTYEFWNDMDKILNAIVAYQEKTIEFNKRFINPWVKLGNVFDKEEGTEAIVAHKNAVEIDPENAQNWYDLANTYTRSGDFEKSIQAYQKAIELGFESGEIYKNLALAYVMTARHQESIPVFLKAMDMLKSDKDKAVVWNHLGNVYRKLNNYELALQAFQHADQFESAIAEEPPSMEADEEIAEVAVVQADEASASQTTDEPATVMESAPTSEETGLDVAEEATSVDVSLEVEQTEDHQEEVPDSAPDVPASKEIELPVAEGYKIGEVDEEFDYDMPVVLEVDFSIDSPASPLEETITEEPIVEYLASSEENEVSVSEEGKQEELETEDSVDEFLAALDEDELPTSLEAAQDELEAEEEASVEEPVAEFQAELKEDEVPVSAEAMQEESETGDTVTGEEPVAEFLAKLEEDEEPISVEAMQEESETEEEATVEEPVAEFLAKLEEDEEPTPVEAMQEEPKIEAVATVVEEPVADFLANLEEDEVPVSAEITEHDSGDDENGEEDFNAALDPIAIPMAEERLSGNVFEESLEASKMEKEVEPTLKNETVPTFTVYEEYWEDNSNAVGVNLAESQLVENQNIAMAPADVEVTNSEIDMDVNTDFTVEMDTKNAHVWNELGNVYFNAGSFDDAIAAYNKAIELNKQFAWPYTNLAMAFAQKGRLAEAVLLYQRSIELFSNEKEKAVTWNRLGDVYRRLNDYENAIAAYQRADELDPGNTGVTHQSRFSLLGSEKVNQDTGYSL